MFDREDRARHPPETGLIERPTVTRLAFWNAGFVTFRFGDVSPTDPFRIAAHRNAMILAVRLVRQNSCGSRLRVSESSDGDWVIAFYLRPGAGGLFSVIHAGKSESHISAAGELVAGNEL